LISKTDGILANDNVFYGTFLPQVSFATGMFPSAMAVADFNGDHRLDFAISNYSSNSVSVIFGNKP
jgi:hypothetical protein